jgi:membrane peptidoglycan carboxypeptidase
LKSIKRFFSFLIFFTALWLLFLFTFSTIYPIANKVNEAVAKQVAVNNSNYLNQNKIPKLFENAIIQTEDTRFYSHFGIDLIGIGRSIWTDVKSEHFSQGGSTITQQLIRNTIIAPEKTFYRKVKEIILAIALERFMSKNRILEDYLNVIYFGHGAYGAEQAADTYFGKPLNSLSLAEWALLAGLPNAPSAYDPYVAMNLAKERQHEILLNLVESKAITQIEADIAFKQKIQLRDVSAQTKK